MKPLTLDLRVGRVYSAKKPAVQPATGHCKERAKPGGCPLHNLHCGYPECDRLPAAKPARIDPDDPRN